jgi:hypothetical protein
LAREDYAAAMKTGVVLRKLRSVRDGKETPVVTEYEINTALNGCSRRLVRWPETGFEEVAPD